MSPIISDFTLYFLIFTLVTVLGFYFYFSRNNKYWTKLGVKHVKPEFFFGNVAPCILAQKPPTLVLQDIYQSYEKEKMIGFYVFDKPYLMLRDPDLIKNVFIKHFNNFSNKMLAADEKDSLGRNNLFLAKNPPWKHIRQKMTSIFTSGKLKRMFELQLEICRDLETHLEKLNIDEKIGKDIEMKEINAKLMTDIIGITAFGMRFNSLLDPNAEFRNQGRKMFRSSYKRYFQMMAIFFIPALRPFTNPKFFDDKGSEFLRTVFWNVIDERIKSGIKKSDFIDLLIEIKKNQENDDRDSYKLEGDALVAQAAVIFSGGFETTSTTLTFLMYELAKHPEIQLKLRNELLEGLEQTGGKVTYELINNSLPYLDAVVHETLRIYPVLAWLDRLPENDYTFDGTNVTVEKGTTIILPMRAMHMDPKYFPDPERFDPERFSEENKGNIVPFSYFPFGAGPRNCIGARLGLIQVKLGVIHFLKQYEVSLSKASPMPIKFDRLNILTHASGGLHLNIKKIPDIN